jgi:glycosyltransferase involved in cell wall biosynthesis
MEAVQLLRRSGRNVVLEFLGSSREDMARNLRLQKYLTQAPAGAFLFHGRVPAERVLPITAKADFCILLRDRARWSNACFPSKVTECQTLGVPMICNQTSDLDEVLRDGANALIVPNVSTAALVATLERALALTPSERDRFRAASIQSAVAHFDFRQHAEQLGEFMLACKKDQLAKRSR